MRQTEKQQKQQKVNRFAHKRPKNYFQLVQKIGTQGKYQNKVILIFAIIWATTGIFILNFHMFFLNQRFSCQSLGLISPKCRQHICRLPRQNWDDFIAQKDKISTSIAMQFGPYYCSDHIYLTYSKNLSYFGAFVNILIFSYIGDNVGRRKALIFSLLQFAIGSILLPMSTHLVMVTIALFLCVGGSTCASLYTIPILNEMFQNSSRQKYSIAQLILFSLFGIVGTMFLYLVPNWRIFGIVFIAIPTCLSLFLTWLHVQETPLFLLRRQKSRTLKCLNRIGKINFNILEILEQEDLISVKMQMQNSDLFNSIKINFISILKYPSLRITFICCILYGFSVFSQFYAPASILLQRHNENHIYLITCLIRLSQLSVFIPIYFFILEISRNSLAQAVFTCSSLIAVVLMFLKEPSVELDQIQTILHIVFIFLHRALTSIVVCYFYLYISELFPLKINAHILGFSTILVPFAIIFLQVLVRSNSILFILTAVFSFISLALTLKLNKTKDSSLSYQIDQIQRIKQQMKKQQPVRKSFRRASVNISHNQKVKSPHNAKIRTEYAQ